MLKMFADFPGHFFFFTCSVAWTAYKTSQTYHDLDKAEPSQMDCKISSLWCSSAPGVSTYVLTILSVLNILGFSNDLQRFGWTPAHVLAYMHVNCPGLVGTAPHFGPPSCLSCVLGHVPGSQYQPVS